MTKTTTEILVDENSGEIFNTEGQIMNDFEILKLSIMNDFQKTLDEQFTGQTAANLVGSKFGGYQSLMISLCDEMQRRIRNNYRATEREEMKNPLAVSLHEILTRGIQKQLPLNINPVSQYSE